MRKTLFSRFISHILLIFWKVYGKLPETGKHVVISAPHEKRRETWLGYALGELHNAPKYRFYMKHQIKEIPIIGNIMMHLGMVPIVRTKEESKKLGIPKDDYIKIGIDIIEKEPGSMLLAIAPEGTTEWEGLENAPRWRKGPYAIAVKTNTSIICIAWAHKREKWWHLRKKVYISEPMYMTGNFQKDRKTFIEWYACVPGYVPKIFEEDFIF